MNQRPALPGVCSTLHLKEAESTQTLARALAEQGAEDRMLIWADRQTQGRGRMARRWSSPAGGLYISLILRPSFAPAELAAFSLMTAEAAARALQGLSGIEMAIKPPNDVLASTRSGPRKICGILSQASGPARRLDWLVVGVGINVNAAPRTVGAASLKSITERTWEIEDILREFLTQFFSRYARFP